MRTRRAVMTVMTIACLIVTVAAGGFIARSYFRQDDIAYIRVTSSGEVITGVTVLNGVANFIRIDATGPNTLGHSSGWNLESTPNRMPTWQMGGFAGFWSNEYDTTHSGGVTAHVSQRGVPLWFVALLSAILPMWRLIAYRRTFRRGRVGFDVAPPIGGAA